MFEQFIVDIMNGKYKLFCKFGKTEDEQCGLCHSADQSPGVASMPNVQKPNFQKPKNLPQNVKLRPILLTERERQVIRVIFAYSSLSSRTEDISAEEKTAIYNKFA